MEDSDGMYGMTGNSIASIFRDQAQIQQINRRIAIQKAAKEDAEDAKREKRIGQGIQAGYKAGSAYSTKQNRIARDIAGDDDYLSEDASGINPFKKGAKRVKLNKKFDALPENEKTKYLLKMKQENPDQFKALSSKETSRTLKHPFKGKVDPKGQIANVNMKTSGAKFGSKGYNMIGADGKIDSQSGKFAGPTDAFPDSSFSSYKAGPSLFDKRNQALATSGAHPSTMYQNKVAGQTGSAGNVPGTSYTSADFERGARKEIGTPARSLRMKALDFTDEDISGSISRAAQRDAREASEIGMYLSSPEGKQDAAATGLNSYASRPRDIGFATGYSVNYADTITPSEPVDDGMDEWSDPMEPAPDPNAMPEGGTLKEFKSDNPEVNVQAGQYSKFRDQGISDQAAKDQIARDQLESDPDYQKVMGSEDNYEGVRGTAPYILTEEDVLMDQMINEKMGFEDALPEGEVLPEDAGMEAFQEQGKLTNAAQDAGYGENINAYQQDIDKMESEGFQGTIEGWNEAKYQDRNTSLEGLTADSKADDLESISERYGSNVSGESMAEKAEEVGSSFGDAVDTAGEFQGTNAEYEDYLDAFFDGEDSGNILSSLPSSTVNAASTAGTLATLADSAGLINLNDSTKQGIEAAQTAKQALSTVNAVSKGTITAASGMGKLMPAVGVVSGAMAAFDKNADTDDRVRGGLTAVGSAMMFTPLAPLGALLTVGSSLWSLFD